MDLYAAASEPERKQKNWGPTKYVYVYYDNCH